MSATLKTKIVFGDAEPFKDGDIIPVYRFPFVGLDTTPGGGNLGRIEWHVELHPAERRRSGEWFVRLSEVWVWASQTRDTRYAGKVFRFETIAEALGQSLLGRNFHPWRVRFCEEHRGAVILSAYPDNQYKTLVIAPCSSISCDVGFEP